MSDRWRIADSALAEDFGDEIVCICVDSGVFYSLRGGAAQLWRAVAAGVSAPVLEASIQAVPEDAPTLRALMSSLTSDAMITLVGEQALTDDGLDLSGSGAAAFTRNDEFNDLVRLDPIHDVSERGWPFT